MTAFVLIVLVIVATTQVALVLLASLSSSTILWLLTLMYTANHFLSRQPMWWPSSQANQSPSIQDLSSTVGCDDEDVMLCSSPPSVTATSDNCIVLLSSLMTHNRNNRHRQFININ